MEEKYSFFKSIKESFRDGKANFLCEIVSGGTGFFTPFFFVDKIDDRSVNNDLSLILVLGAMGAGTGVLAYQMIHSIFFRSSNNSLNQGKNTRNESYGSYRDDAWRDADL